MTKTEELRLICLELALASPYPAEAIPKAREYYAFIKERNGSNVIPSTSRLSRVK